MAQVTDTDVPPGTGRRDFRLLLVSQGINGFGDFLALVAIPFAMLAVDDSGLLTGMVLASRTIPQVLMLLFGGVLVDRIPARTLMIGSDAILLVTQAAIGSLLLFTEPAPVLLCVLFAVNGASSALYIPATHKLLVSLVPVERLQQANASLSMTFTSVGLASYPIGGLLVSAFDPGLVLLLDAGTFLLSLLLILNLRPVQQNRTAERGAGSSWFTEYLEGVRAVRRSPWIVAGLLNAALFQMLVLGLLPVIGPIMAEREFSGAVGWSILLTATSAGMLLGGILLSRYTPDKPLLMAYCSTGVFVPVGLICLALGIPYLVTLVAMAAYGVSLAIFNTLWDSALQQRLPEELLGRVSALDGFVSYGFRPVGLLIAAPLAAQIGARDLLLTSAVVVAVIALVICAVPAFRGDDRS